MHALLTPILLCVVALGASAQSLSDDSSVDDYLDPRFLFVNATGSLIPLNISGLVSGLGFLAVLALFGIGIWLLITAIAPYKFGGYGGGYGNSGYGGGYGGGHSGGSSYSDYQARSADGYSGIFNTMSVLDWIAMGEEVYRKFDTNIECQERLVCELHQNENSWGNTARKMNDAFGYLQYLELLNLPSEVRMVVDNYLDAANKGRTSQTGCDQLYKGCEFSVKNIINKYSSNQI